MAGLKGRVMRLSRGVGDGEASPGLVWCTEVRAAVDRGDLAEGEFVARDFYLTRRVWPDGPDEGYEVQRVTRDPEDQGRVFDGGVEVGYVRRGKLGGVVIELAEELEESTGLAAS